jgi:hypothetical protein
MCIASKIRKIQCKQPKDQELINDEEQLAGERLIARGLFVVYYKDTKLLPDSITGEKRLPFGKP